MDSVEDAALVARARRLAASGDGRRIRVANDVPIGDFARAVGVSTPTIWRWEKGDNAPRGERAIRYLRVLDSLTKDEL